MFLKLEVILEPYKTQECYEILPESVLVEMKMVDCRDRHNMVLICLALPCVGQQISDMVTLCRLLVLIPSIHSWE